MANFAFRLTIFCIFACFTLLPAVPAFGGGRQERDLARADELIANREFDEAIQILGDFTRRNPGQFDEAQRRIRRINQIREEFNQKANELIEVLINNPDDHERILRLTTQLYALENANSPLITNFVARAQEISRFNITRTRLQNILESGRNYIDTGDGVAAIHAYAEGMDFMREEFFAGGFGITIENEVRLETERLNSLIAQFRQASEPLYIISAEYIQAVNASDLTGINETAGRLTWAAENFIDLKQQLYSSSGVFSRLLSQIRATHPEVVDRNHLTFLSLVIHGRPGEPVQEGMIGAFDVSWKNSIEPVLTAVTKHLENGKNAAIAHVNAENYSLVPSELDRMESYVNLTHVFFERNLRFFANANLPSITMFGHRVLQPDIPGFIEVMALNEANNFLLQASSLPMHQFIDRASLARWQEGRLSFADALGNEQETRNSIIELRRALESIITNANLVNSQMNSYHGITHITDALQAIGNKHSAFVIDEQRSVQRYYTIALQNFQNNLAARRVQLQNGTNLFNGQSTVNDDGIVIIYRYPTESLQEFTAMLSASQADLQNINSILNQLANEPVQITTVPEIARINSSFQAAISEMNSLRSQANALSQTARTRSMQAEAYRQEGERLLREGQLAYQRQDFITARDRIQRADLRFNDSLEVQESISLRQLRDGQLFNLGQSIAAAENELIIAEVRNMLNTARNFYFNGNFQTAEDNLLRARNRWLVTNTEENDEVQYWLNMVRTAQTAVTGREILPTAPLFPEMSQLLSQANRNFEEGVRLYNTGQRTLGTERFEEARQLTREVRLVFPINQEAGILDLRIEQFLDPGVFNASFEQRLNTARAGTRPNVRDVTAFADLQNLAQINPNYPGIRAILTQAEIDMGYRRPPPNPADVARSNDLTASARRIIESQNTPQYQIALAQLNEAISLNPENSAAQRFRDNLIPLIIAPPNIVPTSEDELIYQQALREVNAGNWIIAFSYTQRLMQNPRNRNITKIVELHRRIEVMMQ